MVTLLIFSVFSFVCAWVLPAVIDKLINDGINQQMVLDSPDASNYAKWASNTQPDGEELIYNIRMFHVVNPDAILNGSKPIVVEKGPYAYQEHWQHWDVTWSEDKDVVTYLRQRFYVFDQSLSAPGVSDTDMVTSVDWVITALLSLLRQNGEVINAGITAAIDKISADQPFIKLLWNQIIGDYEPWSIVAKGLMCFNPGGITPFATRPVADTYWGHLHDPFLEFIVGMTASMNLTLANFTTAVPGATVNYTSYEDIKRRGQSSTIHTGVKNMNQLNQYEYYMGMKQMWVCNNIGTGPAVGPDEWPSCYQFQPDWTPEQAKAHGYILMWDGLDASAISGTDGSMWKHPIDDEMMVFIDDIYRSGYSQYKMDVTWRDLNLRRYGLRDEDLLNAEANPVNSKYFSFGPSGLSNFTHVANFPLFASKPHFYGGDESLSSSIDGLHPDINIHDTFLDIEPYTGATFRAAKRLQLSVQMTNLDMPVVAEDVMPAIIDMFNRIVNNEQLAEQLQCLNSNVQWHFQNGEIFFPHMWAEEMFEIDESTTDDVKNQIYWTISLRDAVQMWCLVVSAALLLTLIFMVLTRKMSRQEMEEEMVSSKRHSIHHNNDYHYMPAQAGGIFTASSGMHANQE